MDGKSEDLFAACRDGDLDIVKKLLDEGVDVNFRDEQGFTFLLIASIFSEHLGIVDELISRGADVDAVDDHNRSPMMVIFRNTYSIQIVKKLLDYGANYYDITDDEGKKMVDYLQEHEKTEIEEYISNLPCDVKPARK